MDNDKKLVKLAKQTVKKALFRQQYRGFKILSPEEGNQEIARLVRQGQPAMIARCGATEMRCAAQYYRGKGFNEKIRRECWELSGIYPPTPQLLERFCQYYTGCLKNADIMAVWGPGAESRAIKENCPSQTIYTQATALEPYYFDQPWSRELEGKRVLVVHPFAKTIQSQYQKREQLFADPRVLPRLESLECIPAVQSIAGQKPPYKDWFEALEWMKDQMSRAEYDVAIIGAGAYGLPLAAHAKAMGKIGIQIAGATQILFGIRGKRWDADPVISQFYNDAWVRPAPQETPSQLEKVEGGSYW